MSYCGACGGFYSPECPRRADAVCSPAPKPHEELHVLAMAAIAVANATVAGMVSRNTLDAINGMVPTWDQGHFREALQPLVKILEKVQPDAT